jgi:hypothetical protein
MARELERRLSSRPEVPETAKVPTINENSFQELATAIRKAVSHHYGYSGDIIVSEVKRHLSRFSLSPATLEVS